MDTVVGTARDTIRKGSKSFAGAAALLPPATRECVYLLYAWCRHCDDEIDSQRLGRDGPTDAAGAGERLRALEAATRAAVLGDATGDPVFLGLQRVVREHEIPHVHLFELLRGFAMDVENRRYRTLDDTLTYCYHVAGVVGVMMACVMGARAPAAFDRASDLGLAFQLTNIARDVMDDARAGRIYLPLDWLAEAGVAPEAVLAEERRDSVAAVVRRLLREAERYYDSAALGLRWLDFRCAWSIAAASRIYREIGGLVERRGPRAWDTRAVVPAGRKAMLALLAGGPALLAQMPGARDRAAPRRELWMRPVA